MRRRAQSLGLLALALAVPARAHDIPNERVDRAIQSTLTPGRLRVDYEVSLAELTLAQDLRRLVGVVHFDDLRSAFDRYGEVTAPLNALGLFVVVDGHRLPLRVDGFDLTVEEHPRYTFHFSAALPPRGRLAIRDENYVESKGTSRLAIRGRGVAIRGDDLPADVDSIEIKPSWMMTDAEEQRTRRAEVDFESGGLAERPASAPAPAWVMPMPSPPRSARAAGGMAGLLDRANRWPWLFVGLLAFGLGATHAIQPGHGKTLVAAAAVGGRGRARDGVLLALLTTAAHMSSVIAIALGLWLTRSTRYADWNAALARTAGFAIAAVGAWRLGRHLAGFGEHDGEPEPGDLGGRSLVGLGLAGGLVPCWDAVLLIVLSEAMGRLALGLWLLAAFSLGMGAVLVAVGLAVSKIRGWSSRWENSSGWTRSLGLASGTILVVIGVWMMSGSWADKTDSVVQIKTVRR